MIRQSDQAGFVVDLASVVWEAADERFISECMVEDRARSAHSRP
jgi:hypothetical protein